MREKKWRDTFFPWKKQEISAKGLQRHAGGACTIGERGRLTYLLTSVTFDRDCSALQIINQQGSIIIEAERKAEEIRGRRLAKVTLTKNKAFKLKEQRKDYHWVVISSSIVHINIQISYSFSLFSFSPSRSSGALWASIALQMYV